MMKPDYTLYLITDSRLAQGRTNREVVEAAVSGGATLVQYREKAASTRRMIEEATELHDLLVARHIPLIINDRIDVALAVGAEGVHVGQDDMPARLARRLIGQNRILGVSASNVEEAIAAAADGADYLGVGAIFATGTKGDAGAPIGVEGLLQVVQVSPIPVVAIAGINASNAASAIRAGAAGVAVISAIVGAEDVERAAREIRQMVERARA